MNRNEYRRAFIMLRAARQGYGGHARLERRTLTGSLYFIVTAPEGAGTLRAALAGQRDGQYYAASLGELTRDRRGQLTLAWQFDPRNIDGRPLEAYAWAVVADTGGRCAVVLTGNVEGSRQLDPAALDRAVCALFAGESAPAADLPPADVPSDSSARTDAPPSAPEAAETDSSVESVQRDEAEGTQAVQGDVKIYTGSRARIFTAMSGKNEATESQADAPAESGAARQAESPAESQAALAESRDDSDGTGEASDADYAAPQTAAERLGLDITQAWAPALEPLRRLFATQAPLEDAPDEEYVYISTPMPQSSGYTACLVGLRAQDGQPAGLRYALPARYSPQPPAGLEAYRWLGGSGEGYWVLDLPV